MQVIVEPLVYPERWSLTLEQEIISWIDDIVFKALNDIIEDDKLFADRQNEVITKYGVVESPLIKALNNGDIWYVGDTFYGNLNSSISKDLRNLGAKFNNKSNAFVLAMDKMPYSLRSALIASKAKAKEVHDKSVELLNIMFRNVRDSKILGIVLMPSLLSMLSNAKKSVDDVVPDESVFEVAGSIKNRISGETITELEQSVREYALKILKDLNACIVKNATAYDGRTDKLKDCVRLYRSISKRHANNLAVQYTAILVAKYIKERAKSLGSTTYIWNTKLDNRVRHSHERLEGQTFNWDDPPIVDLNTGRRANPGEDYNCRCSAKIVLNLTNTLKEEGVLV